LTVSDTLNVDASCGNNNGMIALEVTGGTAPYVYAWDNNDLTYFSDSIAAGDYVVTVTDDHACETLYPYTIINAGGGHIELISITDVTCFGDSTGGFEVKMSEGYPNFSFGTYISGSLVDTLAPGTDSIYTVTNLPSNPYLIRALEGGSCNSTFEISIGSNSEIVISEQVTDLSCFEQTDGQIALTVTGGVPSLIGLGYSYDWSGPNVSNLVSEDLLLLDVGSYSVSVSDSLQCQVSLENIQVSQPGAPGVSIGIENEEQCYGFEEGKITAVGIGGTPPYSYKWSNGTWSDNSQIIDSLVSGTYHLLLTDLNDCLIADSNITISDYAAIIIQDSIYYYGARAGIELTVLGGTPAYEYEWEDADQVSISNDSKIDNLINGTYTVRVSDFYGCAVSADYLIEIPFIVPTLISPNADGYNDTWQIPSIESYDDIHIEIYNRWGNLVFTFDGSGESYGQVSNQFDGTYNGKDLPIGSYVYIIDLKDGKDAIPGTLSIVRTR
jgi:gliding motility-associated-like protein